MIPVTWRASAAYLLRHPWQFALAILGISIGVSVIVAVDLATASARKAFLLSMDSVTGEATHQVVGGPLGIDEQDYARLRVVHGFRHIAPVVEGSVSVNGVVMQVLGIDLFAEREIRTFTAKVLSGHDGADNAPASQVRALLLQPGSVMLSSRTAESLGLAIADRFEILADGRANEATLIAVFDDDRAPGLGKLLFTDIATAQAWLAKTGWLSRIDVRASGEADDYLARLEAALPDGARLLSAAGRTRNTADLSAAFMTNLSAMSLLALLVGLFLIYNSVSFSVLQRRSIIGILRALGVTRRQVLCLVLGESALMGLVAAALGIALGVFLGEHLLSLVSRSINDFYFRVTVTDVAVAPLTIVKGFAAGVVAAIVAAAVPAIEATSFAPRLAMTRSVLERHTRRMLPFVATIGVTLILSALAVLFFSGKSLGAGLAAVFMLILGFALCVPPIVRALTSVLAPLAGSVAGMPARIAISGISASLSRTGVAIVALSVAVSATIGVSVMVDSFRGSVSEWLAQTLQADIYVGVQRGSLDERLVNEISSLPEVAAISTSRRVTLENESGSTQLMALRMASGSYIGTELLDASPDEVWPAWERKDAVLVSEPYAYRHGIGRGDEIVLRTDTGDHRFPVLATYQSYDINASAVLMSRTTYDRHWDDPRIDSIGLYLKDDANADEVIVAVEGAGEGVQQIRVSSNARIRELSLAIFDRTFVITNVLYWLAIGVALIGILGAMLALQLERGRELGTLRALGMTPMQVGSMVTSQSGFIGLISGLAAIPLGIVMAYVLIEVINRRAFGWQIDMLVAPDILVSSTLFAIAAALVAGIYPSIHAARSQPALAMREE